MREKADDLLTSEEIAGLLRAFVTTGPHDDTARAALIREHCVLCQNSRGGSAVHQAAKCAEWRCTLRDPEAFAVEHLIISAALEKIRDPNAVDDAVVEALNLHLVRAGCAVAVLGGRQKGFRRLGFDGSTLRAALHRALIVYLSTLAGERVHFNVNAMGATALQGVVKEVLRESRAEEAHRREVENDARVLRLHQQGCSVARIAREMGWGKDRSRVNTALQRQGVKKKGERYTERTEV